MASKKLRFKNEQEFLDFCLSANIHLDEPVLERLKTEQEQPNRNSTLLNPKSSNSETSTTNTNFIKKLKDMSSLTPEELAGLLVREANKQAHREYARKQRPIKVVYKRGYRWLAISFYLLVTLIFLVIVWNYN